MAHNHKDGRRLCGQSDHDYAEQAHTTLLPQNYEEVVVRSYSPIQQYTISTRDKENTPLGIEPETAGNKYRAAGGTSIEPSCTSSHASSYSRQHEKEAPIDRGEMAVTLYGREHLYNRHHFNISQLSSTRATQQS